MRRSAPCKRGSFPDKYKVPTEINKRHITMRMKLADSLLTHLLATRLIRFFVVNLTYPGCHGWILGKRKREGASACSTEITAVRERREMDKNEGVEGKS